MATLTIADYTSAMKEFYLDLFERQFNSQSVLMDEAVMKRDTKHVEGIYAYIAVEWESWAGFASAAENGTLVTPYPGDYSRTQIPMRYHYGKFRLTGPSIEASRSNAGAFAPAFNREMTSKLDVFHRQINRMMWGDGAGVLALVDETTPDTTLTVDAAYGIANATNGHMFFSKGVEIDIYSAKTAGTYRGNATVNGRPTAGSGTSTSAIIPIDALPDGTADNDYIFLRGARGIEMMGLLGIVDNASYVTTFQNLSRSTYADWNAQVVSNSGTARAPVFDHFDKLVEDITFSGGGNPTLWTSSPKVQRTVANMMRRNGVQVMSMNLTDGWKGINYNGLPWLADPFAIEGVAMALDMNTLTVYEMMRPQWLDRGQGILKQVSNDVDAFEATYVWYAEFGCSKCGANGVVRDIETLS